MTEAVMSTSRRPLWPLVGLVAALALVPQPSPLGAAPRPHHVVDGRINDWLGKSSMVGGQSGVSKGEFVYQDYVYDDAGTDRGEENHRGYRGSGEPLGDYLYPEEMKTCRWNCADLLEFRAAREGDRVHFLIRLNTLLTPDSTVAAIAIGPHGQDGGDLHAWPLEANVKTPGTEHVLTVWGNGGAFDGEDLADVGGNVAVSTKANAIEVSVPADLVGTRFRAYVGTGLWDADQKRWMTPRSAGGGNASQDDPRTFNLAFRPEEIGFWYEYHQAAALAAGDVSAFHADINLTGPDRAAPRMKPGQWYERIYRSSVTVPPGEGVSPDGIPGRGYYVAVGATFFHYLGVHQPYSLYIPKSGYDRAILANHPGLYPHGLNTLSPHYAGLAEDANAVMVTPLARGVVSWCTDYAHLDVLEAWDDALSLFPHAPPGGQETPGSFIDTDRNMLWGYSMGGMCTGRLAVLHPDKFASAVQWAGATLQEDYEPADSAAGHPANGNELDLLQNTRGIHWRINHCTTDEIAPYAGSLLYAQRLEELGYIYNFRSLIGCDHLAQEYPEVPAYADYVDDARETAPAVIDRNPARVTYTTEQGWWRPDISPRLVFDHAYWVSGLRTRERSKEGENRTAYGTVDAFTRGSPGERNFATEPFAPRAGLQDADTEVFPYVENGRVPVKGPRIERSNAFEATLTNLRTASFDLDRMGLTINRPLTVTFTTDGEVEVALAGSAGARLVNCKPAPCPGARDDGRDLVIALQEPGEFVVTLARGRGESGSGEGAGGQRGSGEGAQGEARGREDGGAAGEGVRVLGSAGAANRGSALALTGADIVALVILGLLLALTGMAMTVVEKR